MSTWCFSDTSECLPVYLCQTILPGRTQPAHALSPRSIKMLGAMQALASAVAVATTTTSQVPELTRAGIDAAIFRGHAARVCSGSGWTPRFNGIALDIALPRPHAAVR